MYRPVCSAILERQGGYHGWGVWGRVGGYDEAGGRVGGGWKDSGTGGSDWECECDGKMEVMLMDLGLGSHDERSRYQGRCLYESPRFG